MNTKQIQIIFVIILLGLLLIPMLYLQLPYGYGFGWLLVFQSSWSGFAPIWEVFASGFASVSIEWYYLALAAVIGIVVDIVLIIFSIKAPSRRRLLFITAFLNLGFGATAILGTTAYSLLSGDLFISPAAIFVVICTGFAALQIRKS